MKIDRSKLKKSSSEVPSDCQALIERLTSSAGNKSDFLQVLQSIETWTYGKCELLHWVDVLDGCDEVLESATRPASRPNEVSWALAVDSGDETMKELVLWTLSFTTFLIEHSFSRHLYSSMEHLTSLLASSDLDVVLAVLNLLYMFSKRSNFITRLAPDKRAGLLGRLTHLAASWGGKDNGFGLSKCCSDDPITSFPESATTLHFEFYTENKADHSTTSSASKFSSAKGGQTVTIINLEQVDKLGETPSCIMEGLLKSYEVPEEKRMQLFTYLRLAASFSDYSKRLKCVQARLHALSILIYSNQLTENVQSLLYSGLLEELVELLEMKGNHLMEIKAAALKSLTAIIHLDRNPNFPKLSTIIDVTGAASYHGFLPVLVRSCITALTSSGNESLQAQLSQQPLTAFPQPLATALFSFLYHLASYEAGGGALVSCGMMESLLKVIQWSGTELDHITFVTRAVRVIDLITNLDMQSFQAHSGISAFISRLELEVEHCRKQQPFQIQVGPPRRDSLADALEQHQAEEDALAAGAMALDDDDMGMDVDHHHVPAQQHQEEPVEPEEPAVYVAPDYSAAKTGLTCLPQRAALLKSMLNFLKKAIQGPGFSDSIRHVMDGSLPNSLKHVISNAEYYGPSLFLLATDVVTAYVFQEPSLLSSLQDNGLTDVVLHALLVKDVPATREVLGSLPNVFSALCLNNRGLNAFVACKPFERLFKVLLSPDCLPAMRRRRSSDPMGDTASNLGNAMDELMRHQPSLKEAATGAIIKLLEELCALGRDPKYVCWKAQAKPEAAPPIEVQQSSNAEGGSSDEEEEEEEDATNGAPNQEQNLVTEPPEPSPPTAPTEKEAVPLVDYIHNVMKFVDAILSNNSTDDHCREFVQQKGLVPLMGILGLPNLPIDFPTHAACQTVAQVSKSILNLAHEPQVLKQGLLHLNEVLKGLEPLHRPVDAPGGSVLLRELVSAPVVSEATGNPQATPLLHHMSAAHAYIQMFVYVCRTGQSDIRTISVGHWGSELGLTVLKGLSRLYTSLVWESTVLLALCSEDTLPAGCEFGKADMDKLLPAGSDVIPGASTSGSQARGGTENDETFSPSSGTSADSNASVTNAMDALSTDGAETAMDVDEAATTTTTTAAASSSSTPKSKEKPSLALHHQIKQIKPLLSSSSRLGRALAELFALLVKLCVGSPLRQRRGQQIPPTPAPPSPPARAVASALTRLLTSGLSWEPPSTSPIPRFRLTFFICSVGFTTPMLFDEKKFPYHLMLYKFMTSGGQKAFFDTFTWALSTSKEEEEEIPDGAGEFLDSWLLLLEKMVNPKSVLESPHTLPAKSTGSFKPFDPMKYLARTHKLAFHSVMKLWGKKPMKVYGARMAESVLTILCHILKGEKMIADKQEKEKGKIDATAAVLRSTAASTSSGAMGYNIGQFAFGAGSAAANAPSLAPPAAADPEPADSDVNQEHVQRLMDMGFPRERCIEAIQNTTSLDQATDYLLRQPSFLLGGISLGLGGALGSVLGGGEQDELARALAMSLGENVMVSTDPTSETNDGRSREDQDDEDQLTKEDYEALAMPVIDEFTGQALKGCLALLDTLPDTVYRVCDLLLAVFNRNGADFKEKVLRGLMEQVHDSVVKLLEKNSSDSDAASFLCSSADATKAAARIHLFTLLFEECKLMCAKIVDEVGVVTVMNRLLSSACNTLQRQTEGDSTSTSSVTPKWMTPMLLFIDLHEKVVLGMNRRAALTKICEHKWKLFDISNGKWSTYHEADNKVIDEAFWAGETSVRIQFNRKKYTIQFGTMMQVNEETGNRRPVMISIVKRRNSKDKDNMDTNDVENESDKKSPTSEENRHVTSSPVEMPARGLSEDERASLLRSCVTLMKVPVDADALNAVLRLSLRLTQDFDRAVEFTELGGVKMLLGLTQASTFSGFTSLATLLIRHVMEDPATLRYTMEKVVRSSTANSSSVTTKELHYLLRVLAPAACRTSGLFSEVSREILRVDTSLWKRGEPEDDPRLLVKSLPAKTAAPTLAPPLPEVANSVIRDLLNFLVQTYPDLVTDLSDVGEKKEPADSSSQVVTTSAASSTPGVNRTQGMTRNALLVQLQDGVERNNTLAPYVATTTTSDKTSKPLVGTPEEAALKKRPLMTKSAVCRLLAELVKSYGSCAKLITDHVYESGLSELIKEDTTALAFMLDELLIGGASSDKESSQLVKTLIAALSSCNHYPEAQTTLVSEVKAALARALALLEGTLKHTKIQALTGLICTMIESCPSSQSHQSGLTPYKQQQYNMNSIVKIMLKRGLVTDLARVAHSLDLSSPNVSATVNAVLKPLETLSRIVNQPSPLAPARTAMRARPTTEVNGESSMAAGGGAGTNTTNSEATRAQGDETLEPDGEATEHDISTAAESIDPNSETQLQTVEEGNDEEFDEMMDQLLERDGGPPHVIADVLETSVDETHHDSQMMTQDQSHFEAQQMSQDEDDDDHDSSHSEGATEENEDGMEEDEAEDEEVEEEEEDEDDDDEGEEDEDDEDDEDDDGGSPYDDEFQELEEAVYRFPLGDADHDDIDLMLHYADPDSGLAAHLGDDRGRGIHLPLWSEVAGGNAISLAIPTDVGGMVNAAGVTVGGVGGSGNVSHVTPHHPLLMGRQDAASTAATNRVVGRSLQRHRAFRGYIHLGARGTGATHTTAPQLLQNFLGTNPQDLITHGLRRGAPLLVDVGYAILDSYGNEMTDLDNLGGNSGRAALSSIPSALVRWNEESRVIDGDSVHDCVTALKPDILQIVEEALEEELAERRAKKKKQEEEEAAKKAADAAAAEEARKAAVEIAAQVMAEETRAVQNDDSISTVVGDEALGLVSATVTVTTSQDSTSAQENVTRPQASSATASAVPSASEFSSLLMDSRCASSTPVLVVSTESAQNVFSFGNSAQAQETVESSSMALESRETAGAAEANSVPLPDALGPLSPSPEERPATTNDETESDVATTAATATPSARTPPQQPSDAEPVAGPSGTAPTNSGTGEDFSAILGIDVNELPEGVDPSFLAALPEDMRQEVIDEQRRLQTIRQRAAQNTGAGITEVNAEFLAALPPNIQEEVLAQQRIEQQRQAAAANPGAPIDAGEFLSTLPASLRQSVLADLEESQLPSLPAELAAEARTLRRGLEQRNRAVMHERFFGHSNAAITSILRNTVNRMGNQYVIGGIHGMSRDAWRTHPLGGRAGATSHTHAAASLLASANAMRFRGRQLLDHEGISCLLILLFIDDPKINTTRLHRILRNLCYHPPTREWVVRSLLSILEKSNEGKIDHDGGATITELPHPKSKKSSEKKDSTSSASGKTEKSSTAPSWLNISLDAALGFRANVFQVTRTCSGGKKSSQAAAVDPKQASGISIHPGASAVVCRHTLEVLISLAKSFPTHFLPWKDSSTSSLTSVSHEFSSNETSTPKPKSGQSQCKKDAANDFWETLLRLDQQSSSRKGKSVARSHSSVSSFLKSEYEADEGLCATFDASPFGQLLGMLSCPVIRRSSVLTDKLLRLLSYISLGQPDSSKKALEAAAASSKTSQDASTSNVVRANTVGPEHIQLAVQVLTSKACSEEGLEDVTALLLNLSYGPEPTRETILKLLLKGAQELGSVVRQNILDLQKELQTLKAATPGTSLAATATPTNDDDDSTDLRHAKGALIDRFTKEAVVVTAPSKVKGGSELQLPSMNALTNKTSSQAFFLRVLKVIIQLRESALLAMKKSKLAKAVKDAANTLQQQQQQQQSAAATAATSETPEGETATAAADVPSETSTSTPMEVEETASTDETVKEELSPASPTPPPASASPVEALESLSEELDLSHLWDALSSCLRDLAHTPDHHAVLVLQATVEAFFLVHAAPTQPGDKKKVQQKETRVEQLSHIQEQPLVPLSDVTDEERSGNASTAAGSVVELPRDTQKFLSFAETHRTVLNQILRQSTGHLADGPFSVLVDHTRVLDFDIKRRYFRTELERMDEGMRREDLAVHVRRDNVFEDSFRELHRRSPEEWKNRFYIVFEGEEGQDAGGLLREWYVIISKEIFNPMYALFKTSPGDKVTYMIYESSDTNPNHLDYFKFVGRVIAKAIYDNKHLECYFTRSFYKHILAKPVKYTDMESEDYAFYKGLEFLNENKVEDLGYDLTFSTEIREFGVTEVRDLIPDGRNIRVTESTKIDYIRLVCQMKMTGAIRKQLAAFLEGFYSVIPRRLISIFNEQELELLLSGLPTIDIEDLKANTEYHKYQANSLQIVWFWRALRSFDQTDKAKFLQFVTGSSKVPLQGFAALEGMNGAQKFQIHRDDRSTDRLPSAHTCFNQLDLPAYETFDKLKLYLLKAIRECSEGFGFA